MLLRIELVGVILVSVALVVFLLCAGDGLFEELLYGAIAMIVGTCGGMYTFVLTILFFTKQTSEDS